jgi:ribosomal protein L35AE/L33A
LICYFIGNNDNNENFLKLIKFANLNHKLSNISEKQTKEGNRMVIKFFNIHSINSAQKLLEKIIKTQY